MAKTINIVLLFLFTISLALANNSSMKGVYFRTGTPYLIDVEKVLEKHNYELETDSLDAAYRGELFFYMDNSDSIRCEIQLQKGNESPFILDTFITEPEDKENVRSSVAKFSIWMLFLNALTAILFFVRST